MLKKQDYLDKIIEIFKNSSRNMPEVNFEKLTHREIVQYGYLAGAKKLFKDISRQSYSDHLNLPSIHMYTPISLSSSQERFRSQNSIFRGSPGAGKTYLSANLAKEYFCNQFIPEEFRESQDFFEGSFAQGISGNTNFRKIVFVNESHCLDMYSRNIQQKTALEHFGNTNAFGCWNLEDLMSADFLAVQDIGSRKAHPAFAETLFSTLDTRFEDISKITIFTTNADEKTLADVYGGQFVDRLKCFTETTMTSDSKRKLKKMKRTKQMFEYYTGE